jgi:predicted dehydrogenase
MLYWLTNGGKPLKNPICLGVIGAGKNSIDVHIPNFVQLPDVTLAGICNRSQASGAAVAAKFNAAQVTIKPDEIFANPDINAILIGTWPDQHHDLVIRALDAGKHVLCEARMAMDLTQALAMQRSAKAHPQLVAQLVPAPYTFPFDKTIIRLLKDGTLGDVLAIDVQHNSNDFLDKDQALSWRQDISKSGKNILSMGIWYESIMRWLGEACDVFALGKIYQVTRFDAETKKDVAIYIPQHIDILANYAGNFQLHLQCSAITGLAASNFLWIYGSKATLCVDFKANTLLLGKRGDTELKHYAMQPEDIGSWQVEKDFVAAIREQKPVTLTNFADGVKYMAFTEAVQQSLVEKKLVAITA